MKYIRTETEEGLPEVFVFPRSVNHDVMAEAIGAMKNQSFGQWSRVRRKAVSAGFVASDGACYGESLSLSLKSDANDTILLQHQLNQGV